MTPFLRLLTFVSYRSFVDELTSGLSRGGFRLVSKPGFRQRLLGGILMGMAGLPLYLAVSLLLNPWRFARPEHVAVAAPVCGLVGIAMLVVGWITFWFARKIVIRMNGDIRLRVRIFPFQFEFIVTAQEVILLELDQKSQPVDLVYFSSRRFKRFPLFTLSPAAGNRSAFWRDLAAFLDTLAIPQGDALAAATGRKGRRLRMRQG